MTRRRSETSRVTLPSWHDLALYVFFTDVSDRIYAILGDDPESYLATRLG